MTAAHGDIHLQSRDWWFKVVGMLQQNWALIEGCASGWVVHFVSDTGGIFDRLAFVSTADAAEGLRRNGFARLCEDPEASEILAPPDPPFRSDDHPNGPIYSSGRFWRDR